MWFASPAGGEETLSLDEEDARAIVATLDRYCGQELAPRVERPEHPLTPAQVAEVCAQLVELGLLNLEAEAGYGLWDTPADACALSLTLDCLRGLAATNPGVAFHVHRLALGAWLSRQLGVADGAPTLPCLQGYWGLGRAALPRLLRGSALTDEDRALLSDYLLSGERDTLLVTLGEPWQRLLLPTFGEDGALGWVRVERADAVLTDYAASHGLDELGVAALCAPAAGRTAIQCETAVQHLGHALALDALGMMAIAVGALCTARDKATEYAQMRVQGGHAIIGHPAVQQLLGRCSTAVSGGEQLLRGAAARLLSGGDLADVFAARALLHPQCCKGASDALQAFGGIGYMRDTGIEKILRDQNHLRLLNGTPDELRRFCTHWGCP